MAPDDGEVLRCPLCHWCGAAWANVECRPGMCVRQACPNCLCLPRERLIWRLIIRLCNTRFLAAASNPSGLRVLEIGGTDRLGVRARARYDYKNADINPFAAPVDYLILRGRIPLENSPFNIVIVSYVLCVIEHARDRVRLLKEARRLANVGSVLIYFDDLDLRNLCHVRLPKGAFFHLWRFGRPILDELRNSGWQPTPIWRERGLASIGAATELPYVLCTAG